MSILNYTPEAARSTATTARTDRPEAKVWLNVGYDKIVTDEAGKEMTVFVNLPLGVPIDTMEMLPIRGTNEGFAQLRSAQNDLLKMLQEGGDDMQPGEERELRLVVRLRKKNAQLEIVKADNPLTVDRSSIFG